MAQPQLLRLQRIELDGLFGIYDHHVNLNLDDRVTLLHGPNGIGKTTVLRMVDALLRNRISYFRRIPFGRLLLGFHDGSVLELRTTPTQRGNRKNGTLTLTKDGQEHHSTKVDLSRSEAEAVAAQTDYLQPHGIIHNTWIDVRDGEVLSESEVLSRFGRKSNLKDLAWFRTFLDNANSYLIETQRLVQTHPGSLSAANLAFRRHRNHLPAIPSVLECSQDFRQRLSRTMAAYGRQAQRLDQTFPERLISRKIKELEATELQERMAILDKKTKELKAIGILDKTTVHPFDADSLRKMEPAQTPVMTLYVQDTERKLQELEHLASRARLLLGNINEKFRNKRIRIDPTESLEGLIAEGEDGSPLTLDSLSSGEQHELLLHYDLLFKVQQNTVVLIDEPELSLHVAWQKKFLPDLQAMVELSRFDVLIATHSPYIVGERYDLMVALEDTTQRDTNHATGT